MEETELPARLAGRVIVLDPANRVLLFRYDDAPPNGVHWATPGGGLEAGEDYQAGAARELREETGWADVPVAGDPVFAWTRTLEYGGRIVRQSERFYLARVTVPERPLGDVAAMHVSDGIAAARWWPLDELAASGEAIVPPELAEVIRDLAASVPGSCVHT